MDQWSSKHVKCCQRGRNTFRQGLKGHPHFGLESFFPSVSGILSLWTRIPELCKRTRPASCPAHPARSPGRLGARASRPRVGGGRALPGRPAHARQGGSTTMDSSLASPARSALFASSAGAPSAADASAPDTRHGFHGARPRDRRCSQATEQLHVDRVMRFKN